MVNNMVDYGRRKVLILHACTDCESIFFYPLCSNNVVDSGQCPRRARNENSFPQPRLGIS